MRFLVFWLVFGAIWAAGLEQTDMISKEAWLSKSIPALCTAAGLEEANATAREIAIYTYKAVHKLAPLKAQLFLDSACDPTQEAFQAVWTAGTMMYVAECSSSNEINDINTILLNVATCNALTQSLELDSVPPALLIAQYPDKFSYQTISVIVNILHDHDENLSEWALSPIVTLSLANHAFKVNDDQSIKLLEAWCSKETATTVALMDQLFLSLFPTEKRDGQHCMADLTNLTSKSTLAIQISSIVENLNYFSLTQLLIGAPISQQTIAALKASNCDIRTFTSLGDSSKLTMKIANLYKSKFPKFYNPPYIAFFIKDIGDDANVLPKFFSDILKWGHDGQLASLAQILQNAQKNVETFTFVLEKVASDQTDEFTSYEVTSLVRDVLDYKTVPKHFSNAAYKIRLEKALGALNGVLGKVLRAILKWNKKFKANGNSYPDAVAKCTIASWALDVDTKDCVPDYCLIVSNDWNTSVATLIAGHKLNTTAGLATDLKLAEYQLGIARNRIDASESFSNKLIALLAFTLVFLLVCVGVYVARVYIKRDLAKEVAPADARDDPSSQKVSASSGAVSANSGEEKLP